MNAQTLARFDPSLIDENVLLAMRHAGSTRWDDDRLELLVAPDFLTPQECAIFTRMIDADCAPSTVAYGAGAAADAEVRTSYTCEFSATLPIVELLEVRLALFLGLRPDHGERIQGQRYQVGQQFKTHTDYFYADRTDYAELCGKAGNRTWTAMIYLNEPAGGGETHFHHLKHGFTPKTGTMLCWNNLRPDGRGNPMTTHAGSPVTEGVKYVLTKWYRERPYV